MSPRPPTSTRTNTPVPYTTLFRPESNAEEGGFCQRLAEYGRCRRVYPPPHVVAAHAVEYLHVQQLAQHVGGKTGKGDAKHETIEFAQRADAIEAAFMEQYRHNIRGDQRRYHRSRYHATCFGLADQAHG